MVHKTRIEFYQQNSMILIDSIKVVFSSVQDCIQYLILSQLFMIYHRIRKPLWYCLITNTHNYPVVATFSVDQNNPIKTLNELWHDTQKQHSQDIIEKLTQSSSPNLMYHYLTRAIKNSLYFDPDKKQTILNKISQNLNNIEYTKFMIALVVPINFQFQEMNELYIKIAINYLANTQEVKFEKLFYIISNLQRNVITLFMQWGDQHWLTKDYTNQQELALKMKGHILKMKDEVDIHFILRFMKVCLILNIYDPQLSEVLLSMLHVPSHRFKLKEILEILSYLSETKSFPHQFFYPRKRVWVQTVETYPKFSQKKLSETLKLLQIFVKENPQRSQKILDRIINLLEQNTMSLDNEEIARQWYLICKANFLFPHSLIQKMFFKIEQSMKNMEVKELCLIIRGLSRYSSKYTNMQQYISVVKGLKQKLPEGRYYEHQMLRIILDSNNDQEKCASLQ